MANELPQSVTSSPDVAPGCEEAFEGAPDTGAAVSAHAGRSGRPGKPRGTPKPPGSGRKKGTPNRSTREIREIAQKHGPKAIRALVKILTESENEATVLRAAEAVLDRAYGKPVTPTTISGPDGQPIQSEHHETRTAIELAAEWRQVAAHLKAPPAALEAATGKDWRNALEVGEAAQ